MGDGYTAIMDNGPARLAGVAKAVQEAGEEMAEPVEVSVPTALPCPYCPGLTLLPCPTLPLLPCPY